MQKKIAKFMYVPSIYEKMIDKWQNTQSPESRGIVRKSDNPRQSHDLQICGSMQNSHFLKLDHRIHDKNNNHLVCNDNLCLQYINPEKTVDRIQH